MNQARIKYLITSLYSCFALSTAAQTCSLSLSLPRESMVFGSGLGMQLTGHFTARNMKPLTIEQISVCKTENLDILDRTATRNYSSSAKKWSDRLLWTSALMQLPVIIGQQEDIANRTVVALETYAVNLGMVYLVKTLVKRPRPLVYNNQVPLSEKQKLDARMSFYSGHTSTTAMASVLTAQMLTCQSQNKDLSPVIWGSALTLPAVQGLLRWKAGKHFPTDIFIGYGVGAGIGFLIPKLHEIH